MCLQCDRNHGPFDPCWFSPETRAKWDADWIAKAPEREARYKAMEEAEAAAPPEEEEED